MQDSSDAFQLVVNGESMTVRARTLTELLEGLALDASSIVAEVNGAIVPKEDFARTSLSNGDRIELVRFVGGG